MNWFKLIGNVSSILGSFRFARQSQYLIGPDSVRHCSWCKLSCLSPRNGKLSCGNGFDQIVRLFFVVHNPRNIFQLDNVWRSNFSHIRSKPVKVHKDDECSNKIDRFTIKNIFVSILKWSSFFCYSRHLNWFLSSIIMCQQPIESVYCIDSNALISAMKSVNQTLSTKSVVANSALSGYSCIQFCAANGFQVRGRPKMTYVKLQLVPEKIYEHFDSTSNNTLI